jgi:hypothetical protein
MHLLEYSLFYRGCRRPIVWLAEVARLSRVGRGLSGAKRVVGRVAADSLVFGGSSRSMSPADRSQPLSVVVVARPYHWLRGVLANGATGRALQNLASWAENSTFRRGVWVRLVGSALVGMGCGRAVLAVSGRLTEAGESILSRNVLGVTIVTPALLVLAGLAAAIWGIRFIAAFKNIVFFGRVGGLARPSSREVVAEISMDRQVRWMPSIGMVLCAASGLLAGLTARSGPSWLVACALAVFIAVALLWRPEAILLAVAAFPWLDWLARTTLVATGPPGTRRCLLSPLACWCGGRCSRVGYACARSPSFCLQCALLLLRWAQWFCVGCRTTWVCSLCGRFLSRCSSTSSASC